MQRLYLDSDLRRWDNVQFLDAELILFDRLHHIIPRFRNIGILPEINGIEATLLQSVNQIRQTGNISMESGGGDAQLMGPVAVTVSWYRPAGTGRVERP